MDESNPFFYFKIILLWTMRGKALRRGEGLEGWRDASHRRKVREMEICICMTRRILDA